MYTILVTGGAGFIGSHTCLSLLEKGYKLIVIDSLVNSSLHAIKRIKSIVSNYNYVDDNLIFKNGDIRDENFLISLFQNSIDLRNKIDAVIHFAGLKAVGESVNNPLLYWDINVIGSLCLFKVMQKFDCKTIVFSSSATVYGKSDNSPIIESSPINPNNPYGQTKASIEYILDGIFKSSDKTWKVANLRYFNPIGAHFTGLIGEEPRGIPNNLFPYICKVAAGNYDRLKIFGKNWPTHDGTGVRDYIHVMDLAESHCAALEYLLDNDPQLINLNIGTGIGTSVLDLVEKFIAINNCSIPYEYFDKREGDVATVIADNKLALSTLNWRPKRNIDDMCKDGWKWQKLNPNGYC